MSSADRPVPRESLATVRRPSWDSGASSSSKVAPVMAEKMGLEFTDLADLSSRPEIRALVQEAVDRANEKLSRPEQVKAFELLAHEWTAESEELTPSLKLKRRVVNRKYADLVDRLYEADSTEETSGKATAGSGTPAPA